MTKLAFVILLILARVCFGVADANLVAHYKLEDNTDSNTVLDSSGNDYHGTSIRNTSLMHVAGQIGGALEFNGTADYVDTGQTFESTFQDSFTISFWAELLDGKPSFGEGLPLTQYFFGVDTGIASPNDSWCMLKYSAQSISFLYGVGTGESIYLYPTNTFNNGPVDWTMFTVTITKISDSYITGVMYINGVLQTHTGDVVDANCNISNYGTEVAYNLFFGVNNGNAGTPSSGTYFAGSLDDVMIYNKALTASEIEQIYAQAFTKRWLGEW